MSELYLVRHAQASFGAENYDQLSELGHRQSRWLGDHLGARGVSFDTLVVGDMVRHHETLDRLVLPGLNEYNFTGMIEAYGKSHGDDSIYQLITENPDDKRNYFRLLRKVLTIWTRGEIPGVPETWIDFKARVSDAQQQLQAMADNGNSILAIASGGSVSTLIGLVLGIPDENVFDLNLQYKNTAISHFFFNSKKMNLTGFNAIPHLDSNEMQQYVTYG
jgi:broad specificity phosphatase PhoE